MAGPEKPILTVPRTEAQLRSVLSRLSKNVETLVADLGSLEDVFLRTGTAASPVGDGDILYAPSAGNVAPAQADAAGTSGVVGVALNDADTAEDVIYLVAGVDTTFSSLTAGSRYYLSADTPGAIVATPDAIAGEYIVPVGIALSATEFLLLPFHRVKL